VLHARRARYLGVRLHPEAEALAARWPGLDGALLARYLGAVARVAEGGEEGGPIGLLPPSERFHWLVAVRSTVLQASPVHTGRARDPSAALDALYWMHVGVPGAPVSIP
jgi:hypothetical protein